MPSNPESTPMNKGIVPGIVSWFLLIAAVARQAINTG